MLKLVISVDLSKYIVEVMDVQCITLDINLENILNAVAYELGIPIRIIKSKSRAGEIPDARKHYCLLARSYTKKPLHEIGKLINYKHPDVVNAAKRAEFFIDKEIEFRNKHNLIKERLNLR